MIAGLIFAAVFVIAIVILLACEQHDKTTRQKNGLPPKKYHDITDYDVTTVYTIHHRRD